MCVCRMLCWNCHPTSYRLGREQVGIVFKRYPKICIIGLALTDRGMFAVQCSGDGLPNWLKPLPRAPFPIRQYCSSQSIFCSGDINGADKKLKFITELVEKFEQKKRIKYSQKKIFLFLMWPFLSKVFWECFMNCFRRKWELQVSFQLLCICCSSWCYKTFMEK